MHGVCGALYCTYLHDGKRPPKFDVQETQEKHTSLVKPSHEDQGARSGSLLPTALCTPTIHQARPNPWNNGAMLSCKRTPKNQGSEPAHAGPNRYVRKRSYLSIQGASHHQNNPKAVFVHIVADLECKGVTYNPRSSPMAKSGLDGHLGPLLLDRWHSKPVMSRAG